MNDSTHQMPKVRVGLRRRDWAVVTGALAVAVTLGWVIHEVGQQRAQIDALAAALTAQRQQAQDSGQEPVAPPPADILDNPKVVQGPPGERGADGPPPSDAQVFTAVAAYFRSNPPGPTPAEIAASVARYLSLHPPAAGPQGQAGQNATADQIAGAVQAYLTANPPPAGPAGAAGAAGAKGEQGDRGEPGENATPEQVADAVRAYLKEHPLPVCPDGAHIEEYNPPLEDRTFLVCVKD